MAGGLAGGATAAGIDAPEPVVFTAAAGTDAVRSEAVVPAPGTWINQRLLLIGQRNDLYRPLILDAQNSCVQNWKQAGHGIVSCPRQ
ncbi:hypothetical protein KBY82_02895 [Cyanobium sp. AMD-g]|uniref:hypothetical protein n=1 Tax=Cyanobium sp. AMD-g TaxID=2823699 RepID=UPI0020CFDB13|nr:hypothetical protein [Cyanobium sp. AMD-g]MCP9929725.1 hypothetical protein [Cyanobium sp. AMD-g]